MNIIQVVIPGLAPNAVRLTCADCQCVFDVFTGDLTVVQPGSGPLTDLLRGFCPNCTKAVVVRRPRSVD